MLTAFHLRPGFLNPAPYESQPGQKLNKEKKKRPTHTPVGYQPFLTQAIYFQRYMPKNHAKLRSIQETELHRSRCNPEVFQLKMSGM
jgi:hypothetical protein